MRADGRLHNQLRPTTIEPGYVKNPPGSALIRSGDTWVLCTASVEERVPPFLRDKGEGWVTAEYSMLPGSTSDRSSRAPSGRSKEIERLIGRSLRAAVDMRKLGARTITVDCDVLQADGGTRTAAITGGYVALVLALRTLRGKGLVKEDPILQAVSAVSVGIVDGAPCLDLCYVEDSQAAVDMNIVVAGGVEPTFVEVQGTGEKGTFSPRELGLLSELGLAGARELLALQAQALAGAR